MSQIEEPEFEINENRRLFAYFLRVRRTMWELNSLNSVSEVDKYIEELKADLKFSGCPWLKGAGAVGQARYLMRLANRFIHVRGSRKERF